MEHIIQTVDVVSLHVQNQNSNEDECSCVYNRFCACALYSGICRNQQVRSSKSVSAKRHKNSFRAKRNVRANISNIQTYIINTTERVQALCVHL